jgi:hypothetical protein
VECDPLSQASLGLGLLRLRRCACVSTDPLTGQAVASTAETLSAGSSPSKRRSSSPTPAWDAPIVAESVAEGDGAGFMRYLPAGGC